MSERVLLQVAKGSLVPADDYARELLRERGYHLGDMLLADLRKARNPAFNRLVHALGRLVVENVEAFSGMDAHSAIKRLQLEANVECDETLIRVSGMEVLHRVPRSMSFASMDEGRFQQVVSAICHPISEEYWPSCSPEQIEAMAQAMPEAA